MSSILAMRVIHNNYIINISMIVPWRAENNYNIIMCVLLVQSPL